MFNPLEPRGTHGQWLRMGRGDLEKTIHNLARARAEDIARVNGKGNDEAHIKRVQADIRNRILKGIKVAPTYHVKINGGHVDEGMMKANIYVQVPEDQKLQRIILPHEKRGGNVDYGTTVHGDFNLPKPEDIVAMRDFAEGPRTGEVKKRIEGALPSAARGLNVSGLTALAHKAAGKARAAAAGQREGGGRTSPNEKLQRWAEAAIAAKAITPKEWEVIQAVIKRKPRRVNENPMDHLMHLGLNAGLGKNQRQAVDKLRRHIMSNGGFNSVPAGEGRQVERHMNEADRLARKDRLWDYVNVAERLGHLTQADHANMQEAMRRSPRRPGEATSRYLTRLRNQFGLAAPLREAANKMLRVYSQHGRTLRAGGAERGAGRQVERQMSENVKGAASVPLPVPADRQEMERKLRGKITDVEHFGGGISGAMVGKAEDGSRVFLKRAYSGNARGGLIDRGTDNEREKAAQLIGDKLRVYGLPHVVLRKDSEFPAFQTKGHVIGVQNSVGDAGLPDMTWRGNKDGQHGPQAAQDLRRIALLDSVIGNTDRHGGNGRVEQGALGGQNIRLLPIDHGLAFPDYDVRAFANDEVTAQFYGRNLNAEELSLLRDLDRDAELWQHLDNLLSPTAVQLTRRRISYMINSGRFLPDQGALSGAGLSAHGQLAA